MTTIDPEIQKMIARGRAAQRLVAAEADRINREAKEKSDAAWATYETALLAHIPAALHQYATVDRGGDSVPQPSHSYLIEVQVPGFDKLEAKVYAIGGLSTFSNHIDDPIRITVTDGGYWQFVSDWDIALAMAAPKTSAPDLDAEIHALLTAYFDRNPYVIYVGLNMYRSAIISEPYLRAEMQALLPEGSRVSGSSGYQGGQMATSALSAAESDIHSRIADAAPAEPVAAVAKGAFMP